MSTGIFYARHDGTYVLKFVGDIRYPLGAPLNAFLNEMFAKADFENAVVDLTDTTAIDSTNLGLLAKVANELRRRGARRATLISSNPDITEVLEGIRFDDIFHLIDRVPAAEEAMRSVEVSPFNHEDTMRVVLDAHRTLMAMNEKNKATFKSVVAAVEAEFDSDC